MSIKRKMIFRRKKNPFFSVITVVKNDKRKTLFSLIKEIDNGKDIKLTVEGNLIRDFLSINFLCKSIFKVIKLNKDVGILNICSGRKIMIKDFINKNLKNKSRLKNINFNGKNPNFFESKFFWGNNKKLKRIMNS